MQLKSEMQKIDPGKDCILILNATHALKDENAGIQSRLREITSWSVQNNADESDANQLEKLEKLLTNALRDTKSKKMLAKQNGEGSRSGTNSSGSRGQEEGSA
uniref:Uncharacterized protein n=1 Tax=Oryza brachyantha TaxID=4533 RepID=J3L7A4_ORYBR